MLDEIVSDLRQKKIDELAGKEFIRYFKELGGSIKRFDVFCWDKLLDKMIVNVDGTLKIIFKGGYVVEE